MADGERRAWLMSYDIQDPRRLQRVHRELKRHAVWVQYSVFLGHWTNAELAAVLARVRALLSLRHDDVRAYCLPSAARTHVYGRRAIQWAQVVARRDSDGYYHLFIEQ